MYRNNYRTKSVSLDDFCTLIHREYTQDEMGQEIPKETEKEVFCSELPVFASEYSKAGLQGIKAAIALIIQKDEYSNETVLEYKGQRYVVYRTYPKDEFVELYCEVRKGEHIN